MSDSSIPSLHVIASGGLGGAENFFIRLTGALAAAGHPVTAVTRRGGRVGDHLAGQVRDVRVSMANRFDVLGMHGIRRSTRLHHPAVVQTYMSRAAALTRLPARWRIPHVTRLGGYYKLKYFRHADYWIGNTRGICDYLVRGGMPAARVFHLSNFVDVEPAGADWRRRCREAAGIPDDALVAIALGRMVRKKGFDLLLDAAGRLPADIAGRPLHWLLVGDGPLRADLEAHCRATTAAGRVHFIGWQTPTAPWLVAADVLVCPSREEPLGNVILEGWVHGLPVVATATDGARELIADGADGLIVPLGDGAALASVLAELLADDAARRRLQVNGRRTLDLRHSRGAVVAAYEALYRKITT